MNNQTNRYQADQLLRFAISLLETCGLEKRLSESLAETLLEADLLGFNSHGFFRLSQNIEWIEKGETRTSGDPNVLIDRGAVVNWDAGYLPGPSVMTHAVSLLCERSKIYGVATITIRKSQHIACLAPYVLRAAEEGFVAWMVAATPSESLVSPHGGIRPLFSTNPFAFAAPTSGDPFLFDISFAQTSAGKLRLAQLEGREMDFPCVLDREGNPSTQPTDTPEGGILPLGGVDTGYKGYGMLLWSELMTTALSGWGRVNKPQDGDANSVMLQVLDPSAFGGSESFAEQADFIAQLCRQTQVREGDGSVRIPGERALKRRRQQLAEGVELPAVVTQRLQPLSEKYKIPFPLPL